MIFLDFGLADQLNLRRRNGFNRGDKFSNKIIIFLHAYEYILSRRRVMFLSP